MGISFVNFLTKNPNQNIIFYGGGGNWGGGGGRERGSVAMVSESFTKNPNLKKN